ncbi:MAG: hypothetical protein A2X18_06930 [Bacteroidetes bacterium GWF2_40_14]|nr:MAG: hypothetical protein A2X18_06930 [Bacteroidetes bacterium GWF2_40_14]
MAYTQNLLDLSVKPDGYHIQTRPEMMKYIPDTAKRILDVGCGQGLFGYQLKQKLNAEIWGIEIDKEAGEIARTKMDKVLTGDLTDLVRSIPDKYFDCIIFNDVLEHLADPFSALLLIKEKLSGDGIIVSSIPNVRYFYNLRDLLIKKQWKYEDAGILDKTHLRFFTQKSIIEMFISLGYEIITIEGINPIRLWKFNILDFLSFGYLTDTRFVQFACVVKPK